MATALSLVGWLILGALVFSAVSLAQAP